MKHYDVIVIGGGHAGAEAAAAAARSGALTALISMKKSTIGVMSCNPAIGGLGKGHLVREIDAMDGIMGRAADAAGIQFRLLNRRKGPAVQGPRAQADRQLYRAAIQESLGAQPGLTIVEGEVTRLQIEGDRVTGVVLAEGEMLSARAVVLTAGTFLNGLMHIGDKRSVGGRVGDNASISLAGQLAELSLGRGRLKTGTPPRLDGRTIDWSKLELQPGDADPVMFSFLNKMPAVRQIACGITHTNERTHDIVRENLNKSAMYGGFIEGVGPRYCPSIEDKIVRFADKTSHQIFLEPEGLQDDTIYPNGISTSLPAEVQEAYVRSIAGLENVRITQPGYAIEYDFFDPRGLTSALAVREVSGLYFAGQINGTTGYEEAAAQGLVAGLNAAREARNLAPVHFGRSDSYIGVMVDDLISRGVSEPYRMFTSRAEFRLSLRADNADQRLTAMGIEAGCVTTARAAAFQTKMAALDSARQILESVSFRAAELATAGLQPSRSGAARTALQLLSMNDVGRDQLDSLSDVFAKIEPEILTQISINSLYDQYVGRQSSEAAALRSDATQPIPASLDYDALSGLSAELRTKLKRHRPENLHQAKGIEGMTPAGLVLIMAAIRRDTKSAVNE